MRLLFFLLLISSGSLYSAVISLANGGDLAGGTVTVQFSDGSSASGTITRKLGDPAVGLLGSSSAPFYFEVQGSTYDNPWLLRNQSSLLITAFQINLVSSLSVFDAQNAPGLTTTPVHAGSQYSKLPALLNAPSGTTISSYSFSNQYDPAGGRNAFLSLSVQLGGSKLAAGESLAFQADTDRAVPEPDSMALVGLALLAVGLGRRRNRS